MRARQKGVKYLNRLEVLSSKSIPQGVALRLTWGALTLPTELVTWKGQHDFCITDEGVSLYNLRFGLKSTPTTLADAVIAPSGTQSTIGIESECAPSK